MARTNPLVVVSSEAGETHRWGRWSYPIRPPTLLLFEFAGLVSE